ncbi:MAG: V-type ATP synthase subunit E [Clostridia bacterium]|nr:V-type ATP synthase subunit E [Clostridia bacterium]
MSSGEKILSSIRQESEERIAQITADADKVYREAIETAEKQAEEIRHSGENKVRMQADQLRKAYQSREELERRNAVLKAKRSEIEKAVAHIHKYLLSMPDKEYFSYLAKLAAKLEHKDGELYFNARDLKRLPKEFGSEISALGITAKIAKQPDSSIDGGFILKNGKIEENMTFSALIADRREEIEDIISRELFRD